MIDDRQTHRAADGRGARCASRGCTGWRTARRCSTCSRPHVARHGRIYDALDDGGRRRAVARSARRWPDGSGCGGLRRWRRGGDAGRGVAQRALSRAAQPGGAGGAGGGAARDWSPALAAAPDPTRGADAARCDARAICRARSTSSACSRRGRGWRRCSAAILSHAAPLAEALGAAPALARRPDRRERVRRGRRRRELGRGDAAGEPTRLSGAARSRPPRRRRAAGSRWARRSSRGRADPLDVAAGYARVAEAAIEVLAGGDGRRVRANAWPRAGQRAGDPGAWAGWAAGR